MSQVFGRVWALVAQFFMSGCLMGSVALAKEVPKDVVEVPRILVMGDSMITTNMLRGRSIPDVMDKLLMQEVTNHSRTGAMVRGISRQYRSGDWDWVVLNGGGNDLWLGCGCRQCDARLDRMIGTDGVSGQIPQLVARMLKDGGKVLYLGYLRSPEMGSLIEHCRDEGDALEARLAAMAERLEDVHFLSNADLVPPGDRSFHGFDMIHPSAKGSREIAKRVVAFLATQP